MGKGCPPFCPSNCSVVHDSTLLSLLRVQEGNPVTLDDFEEEAEKLFKSGFQPEEAIEDPNPEYRYPLLHWAVVLGKYSVVEFLVDRGHSPCIQSREKSETPLHRAVHCLVLGLKNFSDSHRFKRFRQILDVLAPAVGLQDDNGDTALHLCAKYITEYYLQNYLSYYREAMESLITVVVESKRTVVFDTQNKDGNTLLHIFAQTHNELCFLFAKKLLKLGAAINLKNKDGQQCTDIARKCSYKLFMYIDSRKRKLRKRNFRKLSHSKSTDDTDLGDVSYCSTEKKAMLSSTSSDDGMSGSTAQLPKLQPLPSFRTEEPPQIKGQPETKSSSTLQKSSELSADSLQLEISGNDSIEPSSSKASSLQLSTLEAKSSETSISGVSGSKSVVVQCKSTSLSTSDVDLSLPSTSEVNSSLPSTSGISSSPPSTSGVSSSNRRGNLPHTPPHMPGDLDQEDDEENEMKYCAVSDLFNDLLNSESGKPSGSMLHSKGGVLKALLKQTGQINALTNETRKIVSEKSRELEDSRVILRKLVLEEAECSKKCHNLETAISIKKQELLDLEESLRKTKVKSSKLSVERLEQGEAIEKNEQLISTLSQIVGILEND